MRFYKTLLIAACGFLMTVSLTAQAEMTWDAHRIGFTAPRDFRIGISDVNEFTASNNNLKVSIVPIRDETIVLEGLADALVVMAQDQKYDWLQKAVKVDTENFAGYYVKGLKGATTGVVMALMNKEGKTNVLVVIDYAKGYEDEAVKIATSFMTLKK